MNLRRFHALVTLFSLFQGGFCGSWSLAGDFSLIHNPSSQWTYGSGRGSSFQACSTNAASFGIFKYWCGLVGQNIQSYPAYGIDAGQITLESDYGIPGVRFTAPFAGTYTLNAQIGGSTAYINGGYGNLNVDLAGILVNNVPQSLASNNGKRTLSTSVYLNAGSVIDVYVAQRLGGGNTQVQFSISAPDPVPTAAPTTPPTLIPTSIPTYIPTSGPTTEPSSTPTATPTVAPTAIPTVLPTVIPSASPSSPPAAAPDTFLITVIVAAVGAVFILLACALLYMCFKGNPKKVHDEATTGQYQGVPVSASIPCAVIEFPQLASPCTVLPATALIENDGKMVTDTDTGKEAKLIDIPGAFPTRVYFVE